MSLSRYKKMRSAVASILWAERDSFAVFREHVIHAIPGSGSLFHLAESRAVRRRKKYLRLWQRMELPTAIRHAGDPWSLNVNDYNKIIDEWGDREVRRCAAAEVEFSTVPVL